MKAKSRVVLAKKVAERWICDNARSEYRLQVFGNSLDIRKLPSLLRSFRDGSIRIAKSEPIKDLGIKEGFDSVTLWSSDRDGLKKLADWFESRGMETSGVW